VFLEALGSAGYGDVLVVDNGGRADEACVGDLVVLEAQAAGVSGMVVWGLHRDTSVRGSLSSGAGEFPGDSGALVLSWGSCYGWR
jgi:regulator of RNase E activity RraA